MCDNPDRVNIYLQIATPGIQRTEHRISTAMSTSAQVGQLRRSVVPSDDNQAS